MIATRERIPCDGYCKKLSLVVHGFQVTSELYLLTLGGCEVVLGAAWLCRLGPIVWDFQHLTMTFNWEGRSQTLQGQRETPTQLTSNNNSDREIQRSRQVAAVHFIQTTSDPESFPLPDELLNLLNQFSYVFDEPDGTTTSRN